ncbi:MAG: alpha-galactosidase, partial [Kiritimatiellales bacterium]
GQITVKDYCISIGNSIYWLEPGEQLESPRFMIALTTDEIGSGGNKMLQTYTDILVREKLIEPKKTSDMPAWWFSPIWCSWGDQHTHLDSADVVSTAFTQNMRKQAADAICPAFIDRVVDRIVEHELPVRTLLIDDRWYTHWGDMEADPNKFPDFRGYIDSLHAKGFKVMAWASIWRASPESRLYKEHPEWFLVHHYDRDRHNADDTDIAAFDFSNPDAADAFLDELLTRLLSDKPGCYNLDGIKFDWPFLIPHNYAYADRRWVGKENTTYRTQKMIYDKAKQVKKDALIIGVTPHPFFQDAHDIIRTYDVSTYDIRVHMERADYIKALCPGMPVAMDEHVFYQNFFRYMEEGSKKGIPMIYNLLRFNGDGHAYTNEDYQKLKEILDAYVQSVPALGSCISSLKDRL